ncbi:DEAD/DEAH box helicase [Caproiciproducens faecalis]|uniref:DEAD/DEAH box helicase n=1 Tax=Caproiciproducens faecalis TaxID=2820301 RepID=A0ABS7DK28_9FIRM|nr:DEAD/DEAH box helicase [Caproiciproducens faecalis]MBW7571645.1 DEAD/DEAH box helicase [Caproiciproducens faecalis]
MNFKDLNLSHRILDALEKENYSVPTPIQEQAIPIVLSGRDLLGCAQTGTGKTAAFAVPVLQHLINSEEKSEPRKIRSLILTPTRELAVQIYENFRSYGRYTRLHTCVVFGGVSQKMQVEKLRRGVDILVATPGRLNDLMNQGYVHLENVEILVLDEADRMLDMGFIADVKKIIAKIPKKRQTLLFSATMPKEIEEMVNTILVDPAKVEITPPATTVDMIDQSIYFVDKDNKRKLLAHLLEDRSIRSALVFTRTKHGADRVVKDLERANINAQAIHGNKSQNARQTALNSFKNGSIRVLVATDIAARGIDIEELSCVFNYDLPEVPETYVHRIGRTGRAGLSGTAVSFCCIDEKSDLRSIQKLIGKTIPVVEDNPYPMLITTPTPKSELRRRRSAPPAAEPRRKAYAPREAAGKNGAFETAKGKPPVKKYTDKPKWKKSYSRKG